MQFLLDFNEKIENLSRYWQVHEDKNQPLPQIILEKVLDYININANQKMNFIEKSDFDSIHILFKYLCDINEYAKLYRCDQNITQRLFESQFHAVTEIISNDFEIKAALILIKWVNCMLINNYPIKEDSIFTLKNNIDIDSLILKSLEENEDSNNYKEYLTSIYNFLLFGMMSQAEKYSHDCGLFNIVNKLNILNPYHDRDFCENSNIENVNFEELPIFCKTRRYLDNNDSFGNINWFESLISMRDLCLNENIDQSLRNIYVLLSGAPICNNTDNIYEILLIKLNNFVVDSILSKYLKLKIEVFKYNDRKDKFKKFEESLNKSTLENFLKLFVEDNHKAINSYPTLSLSLKIILFNFKKLKNSNNTLFRNEIFISSMKNDEKCEIFIKEYNNMLLLIDQIQNSEYRRVLGYPLRSNLENSDQNKNNDIKNLPLSDNLDKFNYLFHKTMFLFETTILSYNIFSEDGFHLINSTDLRKEQRKKYEALKVNHDKIILNLVDFLIIYYVKAVENSKSFVDKGKFLLNFNQIYLTLFHY